MSGSILLAVDDSKHSRRAAEVVEQLAKATGATVTVLHVHEVAVGRWGRLRVDEDLGDSFAADVASRLVANGVSAHADRREAQLHEVAQALIAAADEIDAAFIAVGSRGRSDVGSLTLGSVSHKLLHLSHRPVLVVPVF